jgi:tRNA threonylcarbamoyladenosine biosynthesis protein TsaB
MRILALDTALGATSVAVFDTDGSRILAEERLEMARGHAEALVPMVGRVLEKAGLAFQAIDRFASTVGPGSFTGIRIGIAAARAFALAHRKPVVGVSTLIFYQLTGADGRQIARPGLFSLADAARKIGSGSVIVTGDAAELLARTIKEQNPDFRIGAETVRSSVSPPILWVARLASVADPSASPCRPLYLREANVTAQDGARLQRAPQPGA